jgi:hypothetical protein
MVAERRIRFFTVIFFIFSEVNNLIMVNSKIFNISLI